MYLLLHRDNLVEMYLGCISKRKKSFEEIMHKYVKIIRKRRIKSIRHELKLNCVKLCV